MRFAYICLILLNATFLFASFDAVAGFRTGGGDPDAVQFIKYLKNMPKVIDSSASLKKLISAKQFREKVVKPILASFANASSDDDLVGFTEDKIMFGKVEKPAMFDGKKIVVHRDTWSKYERQWRFDKQRTIVILEGLLFAGIRLNRYESAQDLVYLDENAIENFALVDTDGSYRLDQLDCDHYAKLEDLQAGVSIEYPLHSSMVSVTWQLLGKIFRLDHYVIPADAHGFKSLVNQDVTVLSLSNGGTVNKTINRRIFYYDKEFRKAVKQESPGGRSTWVKSTNENVNEVWSWSESGPQELISKVTQNLRSNGTTVVVSEFPDRVDGHTKYSREKDVCSQKPILNKTVVLMKNPALNRRVLAFTLSAEKLVRDRIAVEICESSNGADCSFFKELYGQSDNEVMKSWADLVSEEELNRIRPANIN